jgi:cyclophilin family peptidyl-prolyl cis-trans isomerase
MIRDLYDGTQAARRVETGRHLVAGAGGVVHGERPPRHSKTHKHGGLAMKGGRVAAWITIGLLVAAAGCGGAGKDGAAEATTAAIGGTAPAAGTESPVLAAATGALIPQGNKQSDPLHPEVVIETSMGNIRVVLDKQNAPLTVENFLTYVDSGFYDQTIFHQVLKDYVILGGAFTASLVEKKAGHPIYNEAHNGLKNVSGTIAMARRPEAPDSATCQFFINVTDNPMLDHKDGALEEYGYCVFGNVTDGMEVVQRIANVEVHDQGEFERIPVQPVLIKSIRRLP